MPDPILTSARDLLRRAQADMRAAIDGLPPDALNWRPAGRDTNSIAAMANHSLTSARTWLSVAVAAPLPDRDRPTEFEFTTPDSAHLLPAARPHLALRRRRRAPPRPRPSYRVRVHHPRLRRAPRTGRRPV